METFYIDRYKIGVGTPTADGAVDCYIKMRDVEDCPKEEKRRSKYVYGYRLFKLLDDTNADLAKRVFCHYKLGSKPDSKTPVEQTMTAAQIRGSIEVNKQAWEQASATLREILDEPEPRRPYYLERMVAQLNLCSDIAKDRARLEIELNKAVQAGR